VVVACTPAAKPVLPRTAPPEAPVASVPLRLDALRPPPAGTAKPAPILDAMTAELARSMAALKGHADPPYFASYEVTDERRVHIEAAFGALEHSSDTRWQWVDVDVRVGDPKLDNTHPMRGEYGSWEADNTISARLPRDFDDHAVRSILWLKTDEAYKQAAEQLANVKANTRVKVASEDTSDDFSVEKASQYFEAPAALEIDVPAWQARLKSLSAAFRKHPELLDASVSLSAIASTRYFTSSEGTRFQVPSTMLRLAISAMVKADDGMTLHRSESFDVATVAELPTDEQIREKLTRVIADVLALRAAPVAEPYLGPAILEGKAAGVFFHEVFGHRIEGHRQKGDEEGQTFAKKIGQSIMAPTISVYDDPSIARINGRHVNGFYRYDDEGVVAQRASLVEAGTLKTFLLARSPTRGFARSNGHGRRQAGRTAVPRQGNLIVESSATVDGAKLRALLLDEVRKQGKPYGLIIRELDGGFTMTTRFAPQSFKLLPIMVYRLYLDGREELVRGADIEGTPLKALADITAIGNTAETFNGFCGAESGYVPVSATSPSLLISHLELAKKAKSQDRPPILPPPPFGGER
jgi:TldD protein